MKFNLITKLAVITGLVIGIAAIITPRGEAADAVITSSVEVAALDIAVSSNVQGVAFGLLAPPDGVSDFWSIASCNPGALTGPAEGKDIFPGDHSRGAFIITGEPNFSVQYTVSVSNEFNELLLDLSTSSASVCPTTPDFLDTSGELVVLVGADLQVFPGIGAGTYSDAVIEMMLAVRFIYRLPLRQTEGFVKSILQGIGAKVDVPDYTTVCRRMSKLNDRVKLFKQIDNSEALHVLVDSSGVSIYTVSPNHVSKYQKDRISKNGKSWN